MSFLDDMIDKVSEEGNRHGDDVSPQGHERLDAILSEMLDDCGDLSGAMVSASDGRALAQRLQSGLDKHRFAAMSSALLALSDNVIRETHGGEIKNVLIQSDDGNVFILHAGSGLLLTVFSRPDANLGMSLAHANKGATDIAALNLHPDGQRETA